MDSIKDLLRKKADDIDLETKKSNLNLIQEVLDRHFKGYARAQKLQEGRLHIKVGSSSMASEVRMQQTLVLAEIGRLKISSVKRLVIRQ